MTAYKPIPLELLSSLVKCSNKLKEMLNGEKEALPDALIKKESVDLIDGTTAKKRFLSISHNSKYDELELFFVLNADEEKRKAMLSEILKSDPEKEKAKTNASITAIKSLEMKLKSLQDKYSNVSIADYINLHKKIETLKASQKKLIEDLKNSSVIEGVGEAAWQTLWNAAKNYSTTVAYAGKDFPNTEHGSKCVLCQQDLDAGASGRLKTFKEFIENSISKDLVTTNKLISDKRKEFESDVMDAEKLAESEAFLRQHITDESVVQNLFEFRKSISAYANEFFSATTPDDITLKEICYDSSMLVLVKKGLEDRIDALNKTSNLAERKKLENELTELNCEIRSRLDRQSGFNWTPFPELIGHSIRN